MDSRVLAAIVKCLRCGCPFAAYAFPGCKHVDFYADPYRTDPAGDVVSISFFGKNSRIVTVGAQMSAQEVLMADWCEDCFGEPQITPWSDSTSREEYADGVARVIDILRGRGGKTVISRAITGRYDGSWERVVECVFDRMDPDAFRFVYYTPETAAWAGASPELLLDISPSGNVSTMALAGTMRGDGRLDEWNLKNREEHAMVVEYISSVFREVGLQPMVHRAETVKHGDVRHLRHMITAEGAEGKFDQLVGMLSPTPALAGWPVGTSIDEIGRTEKHPRYCYGGYIAVPDAGGRRRAYVNLRSFHFYRDRYCIYAGGGITGLSDVGEEWQEAEAKSAPLQRILMTGSEAVSV